MLGMVQDPLTGEQLGRPPCAQKAPYTERVRTRISAETTGLKGDARDAVALKIKNEERTAEAKIARAVAGFDLTFSAPKSVSVAWALADGGTQAVIYEAHQQALAYVLRYARAVCLHLAIGQERRGPGGDPWRGCSGFRPLGLTRG